MNREQAIKEMQQGIKMTHKYFTDDEWVTISGNEYVLEDGVRCSHRLFWLDRSGPNFDEGWEHWRPQVSDPTLSPFPNTFGEKYDALGEALREVDLFDKREYANG